MVAAQNPQGGDTRAEKAVERGAGRACNYCFEETGDPVQEVAFAGEMVWLHLHCERPFLDAQDDGLDIPECLKVENRGKPSGGLS